MGGASAAASGGGGFVAMVGACEGAANVLEKCIAIPQCCHVIAERGATALIEMAIALERYDDEIDRWMDGWMDGWWR